MNGSLLLAVALVCLLTEACSHHYTYRGHWEKTWGAPGSRFDFANYGFAFSGWADVSLALRDSSRVFRNLEGRKILTIGGGNSNGRWTRQSIQRLNSAISVGRLNSYDGIAYDIEEGDKGLTTEFLRSFQVAKRNRFFVLVTISKTAPYGVADARFLMWNLIHSSNIDVISPIMYPSGQHFQRCSDRGGVDYGTLQGVPWNWYGRSRAKIVPSLWRSSFYPQVATFLRRHGVSTFGFIVWCL